MTGGREHQGSSCRGVGVVRLEPFDPSSGSGRGLLAESSNAEDVRPKATARFELAFIWIARWCVAFVLLYGSKVKYVYLCNTYT